MLNASCGRLGYFDYKSVFANRGTYSITVNSVEFYDFLRLIKLKKNINKDVIVDIIILNTDTINVSFSISFTSICFYIFKLKLSKRYFNMLFPKGVNL